MADTKLLMMGDNMEQKHGGNLKGVSAKFDIIESEIIDFSSNINFIGPPFDVYIKIKEEIEDITSYPESDSNSIKYLLSNRYGYNPNNFILGNGVVELIYILTRVLDLNRGLVLAPTFSEYENALKAYNIDVSYHYL